MTIGAGLSPAGALLPGVGTMMRFRAGSLSLTMIILVGAAVLITVLSM